MAGAFAIGAGTPPPVPSAGPDPREIPVPPIRTSLESLPGVKDLPVRVEMPDVMTLSSGEKVTTPAQWKQRREEMKRILGYYAVGRMPPPPGNVTGREVSSVGAHSDPRLSWLRPGPDAESSTDPCAESR